MGDPKQPGFHFCGEPAEAGKPYCHHHCHVAYHKKSEAA
jgi:GcrA cell cycle regulator